MLLCCSGDTDRFCGVFVGGGGSRERFLLAKSGAAVVGSGEDSEVFFFFFCFSDADGFAFGGVLVLCFRKWVEKIPYLWVVVLFVSSVVSCLRVH